VKDGCNKASTWDTSLMAMRGKKHAAKENDNLIALMMDVDFNAPSDP
jgi:hypothetical protein